MSASSDSRGDLLRAAAGFSLAEVLAIVALIAIGFAMALPAADEIRESGKTSAAARRLAVEFQALRWKAVAIRRHRGLLFEKRGAEWVWSEVEDRNGNGLRVVEIRRGVDATLSGPHRLDAHGDGIALGIPPGGPFPEVPPGTGTVDDSSDPVRFGHGDLVSFSPTGGASGGAAYVTNGRSTLSAVVLFGPTARVRVWRFDPRTRRWTL